MLKEQPKTSAANRGNSETAVNSRKVDESSFIGLGDKKTGLMDYVKNRIDAHHASKEMVREISAKYNKVRD